MINLAELDRLKTRLSKLDDAFLKSNGILYEPIDDLSAIVTLRDDLTNTPYRHGVFQFRITYKTNLSIPIIHLINTVNKVKYDIGRVKLHRLHCPTTNRFKMDYDKRQWDINTLLMRLKTTFYEENSEICEDPDKSRYRIILKYITLAYYVPDDVYKTDETLRLLVRKYAGKILPQTIRCVKYKFSIWVDFHLLAHDIGQVQKIDI